MRGRVPPARQCVLLFVGSLAALVPFELVARVPNSADHSIEQFLARGDAQPSYHAKRRLDASNGSRTGWLEATTEYSRDTGFRYDVTAEGGSGYIRKRVLRALLEGEREAIARGETARSSLDHANYIFEADGIDEAGLANVLLSPRRRERILVSGRMYLQPEDGRLVRLQGRLARSPSFWIKNVDIVRSYATITGVVVPVTLESTAQLRFLGSATLLMRYVYTSVDGQAVDTAPGR